MNVANLHTLLAILEQGSFSAAAQAVGCTPSAVSLQVKQLETWFGKPLFDRSGRVSRPTAFALELAEVARDATTRMERLRSRPVPQIAGRLQLGAITSIQSDFLPAALRDLRQRHAALEVAISPLNDSGELLDAVKAGRLDAAAVVRPANGGSSRLLWEDLKQQPFVLVAAADAREPGARELLRTHGWIAYDRGITGGRQAADHVRKLVPEARPAMELRSIDAIVAMVSQGLGVSVVPLPRAPLLAAYGIRVVGLGRGAPQRRLALVRRKADEGQRNVDAARDALLRVLARPAAE